jgi:hypothetical protein
MRRSTLTVLVALGFIFVDPSGSLAETRLETILVAVNDKDSLAGHLTAIGIGVVAGVFAANAVLPAWGLVTPVVGAVAGGVAANWTYTKAVEGPVLRPASSPAMETPSLFHMATLSTDQK